MLALPLFCQTSRAAINLGLCVEVEALLGQEKNDLFLIIFFKIGVLNQPLIFSFPDIFPNISVFWRIFF